MEGSLNYGDLEDWNRELFRKPLRELTAEDLSRFTGKVMTTWGEVNDFKHFLPRIFDLTAQLDTPYEIWIAFGKLEYGHWHLWDEAEKQGIEQYMYALWDNLLKDNSENAEWNFLDYFTSIAHFYPVFNDILETWENNTCKTATRYLANFIFTQRENIFDKGVLPSLYKKSENIEQLKNWLLSDKTIERLQQAFFAENSEEFSQTLSWVEKILIDEKRNSASKNRPG